MKRSIVKKLMVCVLSVVLTGTFAIPSFAAENSPAITPETAITENNIIDVMNYLGLNTDKLILGPQENGLSSLTVGELQGYIEAAKNDAPVYVETYSEMMPATRASKVYTKVYYSTFKTNAYTVNFSTGIKLEQFNAGIRIWEEFIDVTSMDATVSSNGVNANTYAVTDKHFNGTVLNNGEKADVEYQIEVTTYLNLMFAKIPLSETPMNGHNYYYAQTIN